MLTKEEQDELAAHFRNRDLYDPSKAPEQAPPEFQPKGLFDGGFPDVSQIQEDSIDIAPDQEEVKKIQQPDFKDALASVVKAPEKEPVISTPAVEEMPKPESVPATPADPAKLTPDEYSQLYAALSKGPSVTQHIGSGLAGLGDAIVQGVSRAGNPGFQQRAIERQKMQQEALANALRAKYEAGFKAQELGQGQQRLTDENTRAANAIAAENERAKLAQSGENARAQAGLEVRSKEAEAARAQSGIEAAAKLPATGILHPSTWGRGSEIEQVRQKLLSQGAGNSHPQDAKAVAWAQSHPNDPRASKILEANGY